MKEEEEFKQRQDQPEILVIVDKSMNIMAMQLLIEIQGKSLDKALDGPKGLQMVKERFERSGDTYRLILVDHSLPSQDGPQIAKKIREYFDSLQLERSMQKPTLVCLTSHQDHDSVKKSKQSGVAAFFRKPLTET